MRGALTCALIVLGLAGCKSQPPAADPFSNHPIVPPPGTGACPTDPGYAPVASPVLPGQPGLPSNPGTLPTGTTLGNGWSAAPTGQNPLTPSAAGGTIPNGTGTILPPTTGAGGGVVIPPSNLPGNGTANPMSPVVPSNAYPANGALNRGTTGYGAAGPSSTAGMGSAATANNGVLGGSPPLIIPPPPTATAGGNSSAFGGNPNALAGASPAATGVPAYPIDNRYGFAGGSAAPRAAPISAASPIPGTPRPTPSQAAGPIARPAAAISGSVPLDNRSPRPVDDAAQPIRSPVMATNGVPANSTVAAASTGSRQMPSPSMAYGGASALPSYGSPIQTVVIEPNWQPCDGYADGPE